MICAIQIHVLLTYLQGSEWSWFIYKLGAFSCEARRPKLEARRAESGDGVLGRRGQRTPPHQLGGLGERCKLPSRVYFLCSQMTSPAMENYTLENYFLGLFFVLLLSGP